MPALDKVIHKITEIQNSHRNCSCKLLYRYESGLSVDRNKSSISFVCLFTKGISAPAIKMQNIQGVIIFNTPSTNPSQNKPLQKRTETLGSAVKMYDFCLLQLLIHGKSTVNSFKHTVAYVLATGSYFRWPITWPPWSNQNYSREIRATFVL